MYKWVFFFVAFAGWMMGYHMFRWPIISDSDKASFLWFMVYLVGLIQIIGKISDALKRKSDNEMKKMQNRTIQTMRNDIDVLYARINTLEFPQEPNKLAIKK